MHLLVKLFVFFIGTPSDALLRCHMSNVESYFHFYLLSCIFIWETRKPSDDLDTTFEQSLIKVEIDTNLSCHP